MNIKVKATEKHYQLKNILLKLNHTLKISKMISNNLTHKKIQLTTINFISSRDDNDEEREMLPKIDIIVEDNI